MFQLAVVGKTNSGKSTFFSAATLVDAEIASRPFVTIKPNRGVAYLRAKCPCKEFGVTCQPRNSKCVGGTRLIPIDVIDVAGLVPGAHLGRGLGNQFLDDLIRADALIHVVDAAGATDEQGNPTQPGTRDPVQDVRFFETELEFWLLGILKRGMEAARGRLRQPGGDIAAILHDRLSGLGIGLESMKSILKEHPIGPDSDDDALLRFVSELRKVSRPIVIAANKMDLPHAAENLERLRQTFPDELIIPVSAEAELALRRAAEKGMVSYTPGDPDFQITGSLAEPQKKALELIKQKVLKPYGSTGVQETIDRTVYDFLNMVVVYPVASHTHLTDTKGAVLPDAHILPPGTTIRELAYRIHTDIGEKFVGAIDARTKRKLGEDHVLKNGDVIEILTSR